jgi:hypothetical protein
MSVRRRAIAERVERDAKILKGFDEFSAGLEEIQAVIDSFKAEGVETVSQEQFAIRLQAIRDAVSADGPKS